MATMNLTVTLEPHPDNDPDLPETDPDFKHVLTCRHADPAVPLKNLQQLIVLAAHDRFGYYGKAIGAERTLLIVPTDPADLS